MISILFVVAIACSRTAATTTAGLTTVGTVGTSGPPAGTAGTDGPTAGTEGTGGPTTGTVAPLPEVLPAYEFQLSGKFTINGNADSDCQELYLESVRSNNVEIIADVYVQLAQNEICQNTALKEQINLIAADTGMVISGTEGTLALYYDIDGVGQHKFDDLRECATEIQQYVASHENWPLRNPIGEIPDCPTTSFSQSTLTDNGRFWRCF